ELVQQARQRADVVLVAVRQDNAAQQTGVVAQIGEVGEEEVDAQSRALGKEDPAVDRHGGTLGLDQHHVEADLAETTERNDAHRRGHLAWPSLVPPHCAQADQPTTPARGYEPWRAMSTQPPRGPPPHVWRGGARWAPGVAGRWYGTWVPLLGAPAGCNA